MSRQSLDDTLMTVKRLDRARSVPALSDEILQATAYCGVQKLMCAIAPAANMSADEQVDHVYLTNWPPEWFERYLKRGYADIDPAVALMRRAQSFRWDDMDAFVAMDDAGRRLMADAADYGLADGVTIGMLTSEGRSAGFSFAGDNLEIPRREMHRLSLIANYAFVRVLKIGETARLAPTLSARQRDILQWVAEGKTDWEIGAILNLSEHTVDKYMRGIKLAFGASNRVNLVARAMRLGVID